MVHIAVAKEREPTAAKNDGCLPTRLRPCRTLSQPSGGPSLVCSWPSIGFASQGGRRIWSSPSPSTTTSARAVFRRACLEAQLHDGGRNPSGIPQPNCTIHDLRHTFGVHCAQAGVPIVRLQKLLGHASPAMTMRYRAHAPKSYFAEDAAKLAASLSGERNREAEAQAQLAREGLRRA